MLVAARKRGVGRAQLLNIRKKILLGLPIQDYRGWTREADLAHHPPHVQRALDAGLCGRCRRRKLVSDFHCAVCLVAHREQARKRTGAKPWRGIGRPPIEARPTLAEVRERAVQRNKDWREKMRREGRCERCGQPLPHKKAKKAG